MNMTRQEKLEYVAEHYMKLMYSKAYSVVSNAAESEDACQEAFLRIMKHIDGIEDVTEMRVAALCATIARNAAIDLYRKRSKETVVEEPELPDNPGNTGNGEPDGGSGLGSGHGANRGDGLTAPRENGPETAFAEREAVIRLMELIAGLPEGYREVLRLRCLNELSAAAVAGLLGISENTVNIRLTRARKLLRERLENSD